MPRKPRKTKDNHEKYLDAKAKVEEILSLHGPRDALKEDYKTGMKLKLKKNSTSHQMQRFERGTSCMKTWKETKKK